MFDYLKMPSRDELRSHALHGLVGVLLGCVGTLFIAVIAIVLGS